MENKLNNNLPEGWEVKELGEVFDYVSTASFARDNLTNEKTINEVHYIHYGDIHATYKSELLNFDEEKVPFLRDEFYNDKFSFLKEGDLVIADASEDYEGIAAAVEVKNIQSKKVIGGLHTIVIRDNKNQTANGFRAYLFKNNQIHKELKKVATGISVYGISKGNLSKIKFPLPPLPEQTAIAALLSTWDIAIQKTTALIAQKELQKKWLMQRLLIGRGKGWIRLGAGEIFKSVSVKGFDNEELLSATQDRGMIPRTMLEGRVTMPTTGTESFKLVEIGDFVISLRSFQGGLEYSNYRGLVSPAYTVLKPKKEINDEFYKFYFKSYEFIGHLAIAVIGIRDGKQISYEDFCVVKIPFPPIETQTKVAQILQTADKEIGLLKNKAEKLKEQKKGLMQVLLTGEKRLINSY